MRACPLAVILLFALDRSLCCHRYIAPIISYPHAHIQVRPLVDSPAGRKAVDILPCIVDRPRKGADFDVVIRVKELAERGYDTQQIARTLNSDMNLVALKADIEDCLKGSHRYHFLQIYHLIDTHSVDLRGVVGD